MKKKKYLFLGVTLCAVIIVLLTAYMTTSYLIDIETADNIITIGNVEASIDESPFNSGTVYSGAAGTVIDKAPKVQNTGKNDEYVFLTIKVPKKTATFLIESGTNTGKKDSGINPRNGQIFKVLTSGAGTSVDSGSSPIISYNKYSGASSAGWFYIKSSFITDTVTTSGTGSGTISTDYDVYTFCYNKKLAPNEKTISLFDKIQLKSIIDTDVTGNLNVLVSAYAIQADNLNLSGTAATSGAAPAYLTEAQMNELYNIVTNKKAGA